MQNFLKTVVYPGFDQYKLIITVVFQLVVKRDYSRLKYIHID